MSNKLERPVLYGSREGLPAFLNCGPDGSLLLDGSFVKEGGRGPYDWVMDFGYSRDCLREPVPASERVLKNQRPDLVVLGLDNPQIRARMGEITRLANDPQRSYENKADQEEYRLHLGLVYRELARRIADRVDPREALFFPPRNGGIYVREVYQACGVPEENFFDYQMSRILGADGRLMVGIRLGKDNPPVADFQAFVFADDCLASDISAWGTLEMIKNQLEKAGSFSSRTRVIIAVSAGTQKGVESLLSTEARRHFGFAKMEAIVGIPVYQMTKNFYLQNLDGQYTVGDMGKWTKPQ